MRQVRCSSDVAVVSCDQVCGQVLGCGKHMCTRACHAGPCDPCGVLETQTCYCGRNSRQAPCGSGHADKHSKPECLFACTQPCDRKLPCGNHACTSPCHPGPCNPCPTDVASVKVLSSAIGESLVGYRLSPAVQSCPCRSVPLAMLGAVRRSCLDPVPVCMNTCNQPTGCPLAPSHKSVSVLGVLALR